MKKSETVGDTKLRKFSDEITELLLDSYHIEDFVEGKIRELKVANKKGEFEDLVINDKIIFATEGYRGKGFDSPVEKEDIELIVPRSQKAKAEQKARTKEKAEVFTPSWVCNLQNNLLDNALDYLDTPFNTTESKNWTPSVKIKFKTSQDWKRYVLGRRLEITCGEGPYLFSPYDTVSGKPIPVRDKKNRFARIGVLDRKFRVISENLDKEDKEGWINWALAACASTFGYEWQGDNLYLARANMVDTFADYYLDRFSEYPSEELLKEVAEIASWNLWQMDGLKQVVPASCEAGCRSCKGKTKYDHNGKLSVFRTIGRGGVNIHTMNSILKKTREAISTKRDVQTLEFNNAVMGSDDEWLQS